MVKGHTSKQLQTNSLDRYTVRKEAAEGGPSSENLSLGGVPSLGTIMAAIQDLQDSFAPLEPKLDAVQIDVNLVKADMSKIATKVAVAETHIDGLLATTKRLEEQVRSLTKKSSVMQARLEDQEGRSRRNNVRVMGVTEGIEGPSTDLFVEDLVLNRLKPKCLTSFRWREHTGNMAPHRNQECRCVAYCRRLEPPVT
ncbi:hypothetical protein NDU88_005373 [Pleurodeles waltl]|uniref:Uncharacterized protein n=1 Tax=Pleurodeles waltl TaxID=8319 RepID=A0AAV7NM92_PLEWA|nr:hypothetical protein NDU88_005373 [Pleurodeles waltl]